MTHRPPLIPSRRVLRSLTIPFGLVYDRVALALLAPAYGVYE